jgi:hypothetical protein
MNLSQDMAQSLTDVDLLLEDVIKRLRDVRNEINHTLDREVEINARRYLTLIGLQADLFKILETLK